MDTVETDTSLLEYYSYSCLENCGLCCLCQPELTKEEQELFSQSALSKGLSKRNTRGTKVKEPNVIKLQGGNGACYYLRDRRCTIHGQRPRVCRLFPLHVHLLREIQVVPNLACPGIMKNGGTLSDFGREELAFISEKELTRKLKSAQARVNDFDGRCLEFGVHQSRDVLRRIMGQLIDRISGEDWVGRLLAWSNNEFASIDASDPAISDEILSTEPEPDIQEIAAEGNYDQFELDDLSCLPVYIDEKMRWIVFQARDGVIKLMELHENGKLDILSRMPIHDIELLQWDTEGTEAFREYAGILNRRDPFLGYAYQVCADQDYEFDLLTIYVGVMATTMLDLWWRTSLLAKMRGEDNISGERAGEGIQAYEMDSLGMPTIGDFL